MRTLTIRTNLKLLATLVSVGALALAPSVAQAIPGNGSAAETLPVVCDGQALTFVIEGSPGHFATAYVLETGERFVPTSFTINSTPGYTKPGPVPLPQVTCTGSNPFGTLVVTGFFVPPTG